MSEYFVLCAVPTVELESVEGYGEIEDWEVEGFEDWGRGTPARGRPSGAVEIPFVPYEGYVGPPDTLADASVPLMSEALKDALDAAHVDNVVYLAVTLRNTETGASHAYYAFNLVGSVAAADLPRSRLASFDGDFVGDTQLRDLVLDDAAPKGLRMFRLAERFSVILVHASVKAEIEKRAIVGVKFVRPEDFVAL